MLLPPSLNHVTVMSLIVKWSFILNSNHFEVLSLWGKRPGRVTFMQLYGYHFDFGGTTF